jgi:hypothetical protein
MPAASTDVFPVALSKISSVDAKAHVDDWLGWSPEAVMGATASA